MSSQFWPVSLRQALNDLREAGACLRIAVVGIGSELRGDDAAGALLARELRRLIPPDNASLVIDAGTAPENITGLLRSFQPDFILLVDAAQMGERPGTLRLLDWQAVGGFSASTHTLPLRALADYLMAELGCTVALLGIQPACTSFDTPLSPVVHYAVQIAAQGLAAILAADPLRKGV